MEAYRVETTVQTGGTLKLQNLPLQEGEKVEVIILVQQSAPDENNHPLREMPVIYHDPFEPAVPASEWEVYK
ncbi:MAG: hypothetical protein AB7P14_24835 [Blastocatellales bacterium]